MSEYRYGILIDRDGQETRDEYRGKQQATQRFKAYRENARRDIKVFSVRLIDYNTGYCLGHWERD